MSRMLPEQCTVHEATLEIETNMVTGGQAGQGGGVRSKLNFIFQ